MAKKRKKATGFGELLKSQKQPKASNTERSGPIQPPTFLDDDDEENLISMPEEMAAYLNELKARKMGLEEFRQEFGEELDILELRIGSIFLSQTGHYEGQVLAVRSAGEGYPPYLFPMPDADAPVPDEVFDYLASDWPY